MPEHITEGRHDQIQGSMGRRMTGRALKAGCAFAILLSLAATTPPQDNSADRVFVASVRDMSAESRSVSVPLNRSAIIDTTIEIARADVIAGQIVDVQPISPTQLLITGKSYGNTHVVLWDASNKQYLLDVSVELDLKALNDTLKSVDPLGHVEARSVMGNIILTGTASSAERAKRMVEVAGLFLPTAGDSAAQDRIQNHLDIAGERQVLLRCVVAEVSRSAVRELGVNGFLAGDNFRDAFVVNQLGGINPINMGAAADALVTRNLPFLTGEEGVPISSATTLSLGFPRVQMQLFLKAMADNSLLSILAQPNLVAISGETASFLAGGEFPVPVPQGNQQVTIEFREFGVRLNFTPVVLGQQRIRLRIAPEVSELDFTTAVQVQGFVIPGLTSRSAETTVEIGSGQTLAIAGLLSEQVRGLASRVPGIGDVPVLGSLFRSVKYQRSLTELVILVTPEIVAPLEPHQRVSLPTDGLTNPSDFQLYALGLLEQPGGNADESSGADQGKNGIPALGSEPEELSLHGPWGYAQIAVAW